MGKYGVYPFQPFARILWHFTDRNFRQWIARDVPNAIVSLSNIDPAIDQVEPKDLHITHYERGAGQHDAGTLGLRSHITFTIQHLDVISGDKNALVFRRPFQKHIADSYRSAIARIGQALLDIVSEHLQFDRPTGQTEDEQPRQNQNNQDKSAEYFKNYK